MANINDIATMTNYNDKNLLDGTYSHTRLKKNVEGGPTDGTISGGVDSSGAFMNAVTGLFASSSRLKPTTISKIGRMSWANGCPCCHDSLKRYSKKFIFVVLFLSAFKFSYRRC